MRVQSVFNQEELSQSLHSCQRKQGNEDAFYNHRAKTSYEELCVGMYKKYKNVKHVFVAMLKLSNIRELRRDLVKVEENIF